MKTENEFVPDSVVREITERFINRAKFGKQKYGTDLDRGDLSPEDWAQHAIEESHDLMLYLTKWKTEQANQKRLLQLLMKGTSEGTTLWLDAEEEKEYKKLRLWYHEHNNK